MQRSQQREQRRERNLRILLLNHQPQMLSMIKKWLHQAQMLSMTKKWHQQPQMLSMTKKWLHQPQMDSLAPQGSQGTRSYKTAPLGWQKGMQHINSYSFILVHKSNKWLIVALLLQPTPNPARWRCRSHHCCLTRQDSAKEEPTKKTEAKESENQLMLSLECYLDMYLGFIYPMYLDMYLDHEIVSRPYPMYLDLS